MVFRNYTFSTYSPGPGWIRVVACCGLRRYEISMRIQLGGVTSWIKKKTTALLCRYLQKGKDWSTASVGCNCDTSRLGFRTAFKLGLEGAATPVGGISFVVSPLGLDAVGKEEALLETVIWTVGHESRVSEDGSARARNAELEAKGGDWRVGREHRD